MKNTLIILLGPTGVGKTSLSYSLANKFNTPIISSDSRQIYQGLEIGTAAPTKEEQERIKHYFVGTLSVTDYYNAAQFETDVLSVLESEIFPKNPVALMVGGSMMYIDAVCNGIDDIPSVDETLRKDLLLRFENEGLEPLRLQLKMLDPEYYAEVDLKNHKRILHALEICLMSGKPYSTFRTKKAKERPFNIIKIGLNRPREELYERINLRVDEMIKQGLVEEARKFYPYKHLNSLNTVGYKELFKFFDGDWDYDFAVNMIKQDSRRYARKQLSWFNRYSDIHWFNPDNEKEIIEFIIEKIPTENAKSV
jgi:tRNA dimethylallyltransferase